MAKNGHGVSNKTHTQNQRDHYHRLLKDDKLQVEELNNPVNDSQKAKDLFFDEVNAFYNLSPEKRRFFVDYFILFRSFRASLIMWISDLISII